MSIEHEGSPSVGGEASAKLSEQQWFKEHMAKKEAERKQLLEELLKRLLLHQLGRQLPPQLYGVEPKQEEVHPLQVSQLNSRYTTD